MKNIILTLLAISVFILSSTLFIQNLDPYYEVDAPCSIVNKTDRDLEIDVMVTDILRNNDAYFERHDLSVLPEETGWFGIPDYDSGKEGYLFLYIESDNFAHRPRGNCKMNDMVIYDNPLRVEIEKRH